jgi:hypothetical protein
VAVKIFISVVVGTTLRRLTARELAVFFSQPNLRASNYNWVPTTGRPFNPPENRFNNRFQHASAPGCACFFILTSEERMKEYSLSLSPSRRQYIRVGYPQPCCGIKNERSEFLITGACSGVNTAFIIFYSYTKKSAFSGFFY